MRQALAIEPKRHEGACYPLPIRRIERAGRRMNQHLGHEISEVRNVGVPRDSGTRSESHRLSAGHFDALAVDPAVVCTEQASDHGADVVRQADAAERRHAGECLVVMGDLAHGTAQEVGLDRAGGDGVGRDAAAADGRLGTFGVCLGGHLPYRAALDPRVSAAACFYPTDIHSATLGEGGSDDSLKRMSDLKAETMFVWGRQDPHVPFAGREMIRARLQDVAAHYEWHEVNAQLAFLRDEGPRFDPALFL